MFMYSNLYIIFIIYINCLCRTRWKMLFSRTKWQLLEFFDRSNRNIWKWVRRWRSMKTGSTSSGWRRRSRCCRPSWRRAFWPRCAAHALIPDCHVRPWRLPHFLKAWFVDIHEVGSLSRIKDKEGLGREAKGKSGDGTMLWLEHGLETGSPTDSLGKWLNTEPPFPHLWNVFYKSDDVNKQRAGWAIYETADSWPSLTCRKMPLIHPLL